MSKNVTLKQKGEVVYPKTKFENIIDFPEDVGGVIESGI
jgi:hypothetical protein